MKKSPDAPTVIPAKAGTQRDNKHLPTSPGSQLRHIRYPFARSQADHSPRPHPPRRPSVPHLAPESIDTSPLLGLNFSTLSLDVTADWILRRPPHASFAYAVTPNADHLVRLRRHPDLVALYRNAALCCLDSRVVAGIATLLGLQPPPVVTGSDLLGLLLSRLPQGERITIIGLDPRWIPRLIERTGIAPPFHFDPPALDQSPFAVEAAVSFVLSHSARLTVLAVGSPRQERLAAMIQQTGQATGFGLCVGAALEFLSGATPRAPVWMRRAGLEWLHRLNSNPRRLARRYCYDDPPIFGMLLRERLRLHSQ